MYQVALEVRPIAQVQHSAHLLSLRINSRDEFRNSQQIEHRAHRRGAARALRAAHALAALLLAQRLVQALAQRDGHVLRRVMIGDEQQGIFQEFTHTHRLLEGGVIMYLRRVVVVDVPVAVAVHHNLDARRLREQ